MTDAASTGGTSTSVGSDSTGLGSDSTGLGSDSTGRGSNGRRSRVGWFVLGGLLVALVLAGVVSNFASPHPDGLDSATLEGCTLDEAGEIIGGTCAALGEQEHEFADSPLAEYGVRGLDNDVLGTGLSGVVGVLLTFAVGVGIFWLVRHRGSAAGSRDSGSGDVGPRDVGSRDAESSVDAGTAERG